MYRFNRGTITTVFEEKIDFNQDNVLYDYNQPGSAGTMIRKPSQLCIA